MAVKRFTKQPADVLDYDVDFSAWFAGRTDSIASVVVTVPAGLTKVSDTINRFIVKIVLSGGVDGQTYRVITRITTTFGLVKEVDFDLKIKEE